MMNFSIFLRTIGRAHEYEPTAGGYEYTPLPEKECKGRARRDGGNEKKRKKEGFALWRGSACQCLVRQLPLFVTTYNSS